MFSAASVCLFVNTITSERVNIGWWNLGAGALYKNLGEFEFDVIVPLGAHPQNVALGYDVGKISTDCLVPQLFIEMWAGAFRVTTSTMCRLVVIASHPSYAVIYYQWLSFSGCCGLCLEQSTAARHIRAVTVCLPRSPQDTSLQALLPVTMLLWEIKLSYWDTLTSYLLNGWKQRH